MASAKRVTKRTHEGHKVAIVERYLEWPIGALTSFGMAQAGPHQGEWMAIYRHKFVVTHRFFDHHLDETEAKRLAQREASHTKTGKAKART